MKSSASQKMKSNPFHPTRRISSRSDSIPQGISFVYRRETDLKLLTINFSLLTEKRRIAPFFIDLEDNKIYNVTVSNTVSVKSNYKTSGTCFDLAKQLYLSTNLGVSSDPDDWYHWKLNFLSYSYTINNLVVTAVEDTTDTYTRHLDSGLTLPQMRAHGGRLSTILIALRLLPLRLRVSCMDIARMSFATLSRSNASRSLATLTATRRMQPMIACRCQALSRCFAFRSSVEKRVNIGNTTSAFLEEHHPRRHLRRTRA